MAFDGANTREILSEPQQQLFAEVRVRDFAAPELHDCFHSIPFLQEPNGMVSLEIVIMVIRVRAELQFLHLHDVLFLLGLVLLLLLLVLPLTKVHGFGNRRFSSRRNQDKIKTHILGPANGRRCRHELGRSGRTHRAHFSRSDRVVDILSDFAPAGGKASGWIHAGLASSADAQWGKDEYQILYLPLVYTEKC